MIEGPYVLEFPDDLGERPPLLYFIGGIFESSGLLSYKHEAETARAIDGLAAVISSAQIKINLGLEVVSLDPRLVYLGTELKTSIGIVGEILDTRRTNVNIVG